MSEYISRENYVASVRQRVVEMAQAMLKDEIGYLLGARTLSAMRHEAAVRVDDPDFMEFVAIASKTDEFPIGPAPQHWSRHVMPEFEPEYRQAEVWARERGMPACKSLIRRFQVARQ